MGGERVYIYVYMYIYRLLYKNLMVTAHQKSTINIHTEKKKESKHNAKIVTRSGEKRTKEEERGKKDLQTQIQNN